MKEAPREKRPAQRGGAVASRIQYTPAGPVCVTQATGVGYRSEQVYRNSDRGSYQTLTTDAHLRYDLEAMRARSQAFDRDNGIAQALISRVCDVILGDGLTLQVRTDDRQLNRDVEALYREWWTDGTPEVRGLHTGREVDELVLRHLLVDGDCAFIRHGSGDLQFVGADRIAYTTAGTKASSGNRVEMGVELSRVGRPLAFWVDEFTEYGNRKYAPKRFAADQVDFVANLRRSDQTRGEPALQPVFAMLDRINDVCDSEAAAWQLLSRMAVAVTMENAQLVAKAASVDAGDTTSGQIAQRYLETDPALMFFGKPGETVKGIERNIPGANFPESIKMFLRLLGLPLGFTLEFMLLIWSDTNYSSGRASIKQVERSCRRWIAKLRAVKTSLFRWKVARWQAERLIPADDRVLNHVWALSPYPFIDPEKEDSARKIRLESGLSAPSIENAEAGYDDEELVALQVRDIERRIQAAEDLNARYPQAGLTWRDLTAFGGEAKASPAAPAPQPDDTPDDGGNQPGDEQPTEPDADDDQPDDEPADDTEGAA